MMSIVSATRLGHHVHVLDVDAEFVDGGLGGPFPEEQRGADCWAHPWEAVGCCGGHTGNYQAVAGEAGVLDVASSDFPTHMGPLPGAP